MVGITRDNEFNQIPITSAQVINVIVNVEEEEDIEDIRNDEDFNINLPLDFFHINTGTMSEETIDWTINDLSNDERTLMSFIIDKFDYFTDRDYDLNNIALISLYPTQHRQDEYLQLEITFDSDEATDFVIEKDEENIYSVVCYDISYERPIAYIRNQ